MKIIAGDTQTYIELKNSLMNFKYEYNLIKFEYTKGADEYRLNYDSYSDTYIIVIKIEEKRLYQLKEFCQHYQKKYKNAHNENRKLSFEHPVEKIYKIDDFLNLDRSSFNKINDPFFEFENYDDRIYRIAPIYKNLENTFEILNNQFKIFDEYYCVSYNLGEIENQENVLLEVLFYIKQINEMLKAAKNIEIKYVLPSNDEEADRYAEYLILQNEEDKAYSDYMDSIYNDMYNEAYEIKDDQYGLTEEPIDNDDTESEYFTHKKPWWNLD